MNFRNIFLGLVIICLPLEATLISFPLVFIFSVLSYILIPELTTIVIAFIAGIAIDSIRLSPLGVSSFIILATFVFIEILKRGVTFSDYKTILLFLLISSFIFAKALNYSNNILFYMLIFGSLWALISYFGRRGSVVVKSERFEKLSS